MKPGGLMVLTLEHGDAFPFDLGPGQRFRHHQRAVLEWVAECGFELVSDELGVLRQEKGTPVEGRIMVVRAQDALALIAGTVISPSDPDQASGQTLH
jgi:predicted TPR repeat methyltransferase